MACARLALGANVSRVNGIEKDGKRTKKRTKKEQKKNEKKKIEPFSDFRNFGRL